MIFTQFFLFQNRYRLFLHDFNLNLSDPPYLDCYKILIYTLSNYPWHFPIQENYHNLSNSFCEFLKRDYQQDLIMKLTLSINFILQEMDIIYSFHSLSAFVTSCWNFYWNGKGFARFCVFSKTLKLSLKLLLLWIGNRNLTRCEKLQKFCWAH